MAIAAATCWLTLCSSDRRFARIAAPTNRRIIPLNSHTAARAKAKPGTKKYQILSAITPMRHHEEVVHCTTLCKAGSQSHWCWRRLRTPVTCVASGQQRLAVPAVDGSVPEGHEAAVQIFQPAPLGLPTHECSSSAPDLSINRRVNAIEAVPQRQFIASPTRQSHANRSLRQHGRSRENCTDKRFTAARGVDPHRVQVMRPAAIAGWLFPLPLAAFGCLRFLSGTAACLLDGWILLHQRLLPLVTQPAVNRPAWVPWKARLRPT